MGRLSRSGSMCAIASSSTARASTVSAPSAGSPVLRFQSDHGVRFIIGFGE